MNSIGPFSRSKYTQYQQLASHGNQPETTQIINRFSRFGSPRSSIQMGVSKIPCLNYLITFDIYIISWYHELNELAALNVQKYRWLWLGYVKTHSSKLLREVM